MGQNYRIELSEFKSKKSYQKTLDKLRSDQKVWGKYSEGDCYYNDKDDNLISFDCYESYVYNIMTWCKVNKLKGFYAKQWNLDSDPMYEGEL